MKKLITVLIAFNFATHLTAQDSISIKNCNLTITVKSNPITYYKKYYMGGNRISPQSEVERINMFKASAYEYEQHHKMFKRFSFTVVPTILLWAATMNYSTHTTEKLPNATSESLLWVTFLGAGTSLYFCAQSQKHSRKSIEFYNKEICSE